MSDVTPFKLFLALLLAMTGCSNRAADHVSTPAKTVKCPVCDQDATLWRFDSFQAEYSCPNHTLEYCREGYFRSAQPKGNANGN